MSDIFDIINIPEIFYYHVIIVTSSLVTLVTSDVTHSTPTFLGRISVAKSAFSLYYPLLNQVLKNVTM